MCEKESELSINLKNHHDRVTRAGYGSICQWKLSAETDVGGMMYECKSWMGRSSKNKEKKQRSAKGRI